MTNLRHGLRGVLALLAFLCVSMRAAEPAPSFEVDVLPILEQKCIVCHGAGNPQKNLDLRTAAAVLKGGESGPSIQIGSSAKSLLMEKIITQQMPPMDPKLTKEEERLIRRWIDEGVKTEISAASEAEGPVVTEREVLPIFLARCVTCHGKGRREGDLDLRTQEARLKGGKSGPALVPGSPDKSLIIQRIEAAEMPPVELQRKFAVRSPSESELAMLRKWIAAGSPPEPKQTSSTQQTPQFSQAQREHWAFQPPKRPDVPVVQRQHLVRNAIDAFLLRKLEEKGLSYSREAEPLTLLRRAHLDLTGIPPDPKQIRDYLDDDRPDRYEKLIDRLLESPEYGESWARHWLDLAGFGETHGFGQGAPFRPYAWRYRDYVIRAFNQDKPYDVFLTEQIAGDEMGNYKEAEVTPELIDRLAATGFLRTAPDPTWEPEFAFLGERMNVIADEVQIVSSAVMGLTMGCARCHDHKYDPILQREFYSMGAILQTAYDPYHWLPPQERKLDIALESEKKEVEEFNAPLKEEIERLKRSLEAQAGPFRKDLLKERLAALPAGIQEDLREVSEAPEEKRTDVQKYLAEKFKDTLEIDVDDLKKKYEAFRTIADPIEKEISGIKQKIRPEPHVLALVDMGGEPSNAYLLRRGEAFSPGAPVEPGVPAVLNAGLEPYQVSPPWPGSESSGRRLAFARWLTQSQHPLTSRVLVNQLWMRHFGSGLVSSPSNFGLAAMPPSHPELLDWLATEFVQSGWSIKAMHRLLMTSTAYRQQSRKDPEILAIDPENTLLSRMNLRRMSAEQIYDSLLKVTDRLDPKRFGPSEQVTILDNKEIVAEGSKDRYRRSIYTVQHPDKPITLLNVFDFPQMTPNCVERRRSNVVTQALQMMNSEQIWDFSRYMAGRVIDEAGPDRREQVKQVYLRALSRLPASLEMEESLKILEELAPDWSARLEQDGSETPREATAQWLALAGLCHTILNSAEFIFID